MAAHIRNPLTALLMPVCLWAMAAAALAANYTIEYEMDASPDTPAGFYKNPSDPFNIGALSVGSYGSGSTFANGILHYLNGANGPVGYYWHQAQNMGTTLTVDMRVKVNAHTGGTKPQSMCWCHGGNGGEGMQLNPDSIAFNAFGNNPLNCVQQPAAAVDLTSFRRIRVTLNFTDPTQYDYATLAVYDLDSGATLYSPCTGNGGPAPGDDPFILTDTCATNPGSSCPSSGVQACCPGGGELRSQRLLHRLQPAGPHRRNRQGRLYHRFFHRRQFHVH